MKRFSIILVICLSLNNVCYGVENVCGEQLKTTKEFLHGVDYIFNDEWVFNTVMIGTMTYIILKANGKKGMYVKMLKKLK